MTSPASRPDEFIHRGLDVLLERCVSARAEDEVLVVYDEAFMPYLGALIDIIVRRGLDATLVNIPRDYQLALVRTAMQDGGRVELPSGLKAIATEVSLILNVLGGALDTAAVRRAVIHLDRAAGARFAHIPGISPSILDALLTTPFDRVESACDLTAWALGEADEVELRTVDRNGKKHILKMDLSGWDNDPLISSGIIADGSWGNVPSGETFCCPDHLKVQGRICINGSIPGHALSKENEVILTFERGKLVAWDCAPSSPALAFFEDAQAEGRRTHDEHWNTFAELGIGLNPAVTQLNGNPLFDEKAWGTVHIAIGDNSAFGDNIHALTHVDLVTRGATLRTSDFNIVANGEIDIKSMQTHRDAQRRPKSELPKRASIMLRENKVDLRDGIFRRRLQKGRRAGLVTVADARLSRLLGQIAHMIREQRAADIEEFISSTPKIDDVPSRDLLNFLYHYRAIALTRV